MYICMFVCMYDICMFVCMYDICMFVCMYDIYIWLCSRFPPRRLAPRSPNFQGLIYDPMNET